MINDKRRYRSRNPRNPRTPMSMEEEKTGNPALDGHVVRERQPLRRRRPLMTDGDYTAESVMDEYDAQYQDIYGDLEQ